jgi:hypothetical protein
MKDPKITMDTVRAAQEIIGNSPAPVARAMLVDTVRDVAALQSLQRAVLRRNEAVCNMPMNESESAANDRAVTRLLAKADAIIAVYGGGQMHRYGRGSGLWPHVTLADGTEIHL